MDLAAAGEYIGRVMQLKTYVPVTAPYAPSHKYRRLAFGSYGFGHTTVREPGDLRGTVIGRKGRYRGLIARGGEA